MAPISLLSVAPIVRQCEQVAQVDPSAKLREGAISNVRQTCPALEQAAIGLFKRAEADGERYHLGPIVPWDTDICTAAAAAVVDDRLRKQYNGRELFLRLQAAAMIRKGYSLAHIVKKTLLSMEALDNLRTELRLVDVTGFQGGAGLEAEAGKAVKQC